MSDCSSNTEVLVDDLDIIFISFDEPKKDQFWDKLVKKAPLAKRVDGVLGFDAAHKAAALLSETDRFITVDGDTLIGDDFLNMKLRYDETKYGGHVFAWASVNDVNGLTYGNGSLKCWPKKETLEMKTHEITDDEQAKIDFCWSIPYLSMHDAYSTTYPAATPYHAFRAGFREGVKMALHDGSVVEPESLFDTIWVGNAYNMKIWMSVGADKTNGLWCMYGARLGLKMLLSGELSLEMVADYTWFPDLWNNIIRDHNSNSYGSIICRISGTRWSPPELVKDCEYLGEEITKLTGVSVPVFTSDQSVLFKQIYKHREQSTPRLLYSA